MLPAALIFCIFQLSAQAEFPAPRLSGIVNLPDFKRALLETPGSPEGLLLLGEAQHEGDIGVIWINPEKGRVEVYQHTNIMILELNAETNQEPATGVQGIALKNTSLRAVLELYQRLSARTVLQSPLLPQTQFSLRASAATRTDAARVLERALAEKEILAIPDGENFMLVVPKSQAQAVSPHSSQTKSLTTNSPVTSSPTNSPETEILPPGSISFRGVAIVSALQIYSELIGRKLDHSPPLPSGMESRVFLHTETPLTRNECIYMFDTLFRLHGIKVAPAAEGFVKPVRISEVER